MTLIIAEIGQNHNGVLSEAVKLIYSAKFSGADAVKFTMRDLDYEMTDSMAIEPYENKNSYGKNYMEHRKKLELSVESIIHLYNLSCRLDVKFIITFCSHTLLKNKKVIDGLLPFIYAIKIASRDITNTMLLEEINKLDINNIIISTGLSPESEVSKAVKILNRKQLSILHCVSQYPTNKENINLHRIYWLKLRYKGKRVGYSDHSEGIDAPIYASVIGAEIIEKHITLDKNQKGSDHQSSITPDSFRCMVDRIREADTMKNNLKKDNIYKSDDINVNRKKLMRSVCTDGPIKEGHRIEMKDLCLLSPGDGISPLNIDSLIGRVLTKDYPGKTTIKEGDIH